MGKDGVLAVREIKYRGYDPDTKRWYYGSLVKQNKTTYVTSEDYDQSPSNTKWFIFWDEMTDWCLPNRHLQGSVDPKSIGEYTGLHDKNGRGIYESDIVRCSTWHDGEPTGVFQGGVVYDGDLGMVSFDIRLDHDGEIDRAVLPAIGVEIIGNVHENMELLEVEK